jgi:hypothetical protein
VGYISEITASRGRRNRRWLDKEREREREKRKERGGKKKRERNRKKSADAAPHYYRHTASTGRGRTAYDGLKIKGRAGDGLKGAEILVKGLIKY